VVDCVIMPDHHDVQNHGGIWRASVVVVMGNLWRWTGSVVSGRAVIASRISIDLISMRT
jgi:hypothetical protein